MYYVNKIASFLAVRVMRTSVEQQRPTAFLFENKVYDKAVNLDDYKILIMNRLKDAERINSPFSSPFSSPFPSAAVAAAAAAAQQQWEQQRLGLREEFSDALTWARDEAIPLAQTLAENFVPKSLPIIQVWRVHWPLALSPSV